MFKRNLSTVFLLNMFLVFILVLVACGNDESDVSSDGDEGDINYPEKPITVIQGFDPGGGSDQLAQLTQPYLGEYLDTTFTNEYIPGSAGAIAWTRVAQKEENDGYTISITNAPMLMTNYLMNEEIQYSLEDFDPIANVVTDPGIIVVSEDSEFDTYEDFEKYLEENPGGLDASNSGVGGDDFFTQLKWMKETGLEIEMIPYDGDGPSWQAAAGGDVDVSFNNVGVVYSQIKEGNLKALLVFSEERLDLLPDVPTAKELGIDVVSGSSRGYSAPKGVPEDVKEELYKAFEQLEDDQEFREGLESVALIMDIKTGDEYAEFLKEDEQLSKELWEEVKDQYTE